MELQEAFSFSFSVDGIMSHSDPSRESFLFCQPSLLGLDDVSCLENTYQRPAEKDDATAAAAAAVAGRRSAVRRAIS